MVNLETCLKVCMTNGCDKTGSCPAHDSDMCCLECTYLGKDHDECEPMGEAFKNRYFKFIIAYKKWRKENVEKL